MIFNTTGVSHIYYCTWTEYDSLRYIPGSKNSVGQEYDEYALYIVKSSLPTLQVYYGRRQLTDILGVRDLPLSHEYPSGKLYIQVSDDSQDEDFVKEIYYKYLDENNDDKIAILGKNYLRELKVNPQTYRVEMLTGSNDLSKFIILKDDGTLDDQTLSKIVEDLNPGEVQELIWHQWN